MPGGCWEGETLSWLESFRVGSFGGWSCLLCPARCWLPRPEKNTALQRSSARVKKKAPCPSPYSVAWNGRINAVLGSLGSSEKPGNDVLWQSSRFSCGRPGGLANVMWSQHYIHPDAISMPKLGKMNLVFLLNMTREEGNHCSWTTEENAPNCSLLAPSPDGVEEAKGPSLKGETLGKPPFPWFLHGTALLMVSRTSMLVGCLSGKAILPKY